ncbi:MAG: S41 family peptidase [Alphaproteobacteria bacterium]|nr:S41 family peptidase [Alphaproteobacteria bacterium]
MKKLICLGLMMALPVWAATPTQENKKEYEDVYVLMDLLGASFRLIKDEYVEELSYKDMVEKAVNGVLSSQDPHSGFLNKEETEEMHTQTKGEFGGVGMEVTAENGVVRVVSPIDDTPAFKAGLQAGDYITHIDGTSVIGMSLTDAVKRLRGEPKTNVTVTISRKSEEPFDVKLVRDVIKVQPVKYEIKDTIGYLRLITFSEQTTEKLHEAIREIQKKLGDSLTGFILDIRNNPGGLLDQAVGVADTFMAQGEIVSTRSKKPEDTMRFSAKTEDLTHGKPLVVLINEGSASASEIVAGALQDHKRAVIVGLKSFGKGSVQSVREIPGFGAIKITTARYYTPSGHSIQAKGITPDVEIPRAELKELPKIKGWAEGNYDTALSEEEGKKAKDTLKKIQVSKELADKSFREEDKKPDYQLDRAIDILKAVAIYENGKEVIEVKESN